MNSAKSNSQRLFHNFLSNPNKSSRMKLHLLSNFVSNKRCLKFFFKILSRDSVTVSVDAVVYYR